MKSITYHANTNNRSFVDASAAVVARVAMAWARQGADVRLDVFGPVDAKPLRTKRVACGSTITATRRALLDARRTIEDCAD